MDKEAKLVTKFIDGLITLIQKEPELFDIHTLKDASQKD